MKLLNFQPHQCEAVVELYEKTFSASEGESEGKSIGKLVHKLIGTTEDDDIFGFCAERNDVLLGSIFFSRLTLPTEIVAFMLSPIAVSTEHQRKGVGQALINFGLEKLKMEAVELVVTYGDPRYCSKVGFKVVSEDVIASPYPLTYPEGWQAQSLVASPLTPIRGSTQCVEAFNNREYW